jgi:murein DD-endopeptidase MepM/ murein hydrolase activator NlpD
MMHKQNKPMNRLAKVALWAGVSLCCVAVIEAGQEMVKAMVLHLPQPAPEKMTDDYARPDFHLQPSTRIIAQATQQTTQQVATHEKLAINTGNGNDPQQHVAQMTPKQVAANTWNGASFPVENFQSYTSPFGYRTSATGGYGQEFHYGLDMAAPEGSYIRTWWMGKVVEVSDDTNCGTSVVVESGPWQHIYCHMQGHVETENGKRYMIDREGGIQIWQGQQLQAGARLGRVGMTGRTTGPHLHWGLKYNSNWVDPALVLRAMYDNQKTATANTGARATE